MNKINWNKKLLSRKFWVVLVAFITSLLYALNYAETDVGKVTSIVMSFSSLIIYILTEGYIDY